MVGRVARWRRAHVVRCIRHVRSRVDRELGRVVREEHRDVRDLLRAEHDRALVHDQDLVRDRVVREARREHRERCRDRARSLG